MIRRPTVLVLGAGASAPYGFPLGTRLTDLISFELTREHSEFRNDLQRCGISYQQLHNFGAALGACGLYSVDEFLQWKPEYKEVGKLAIARMLIPSERDDRIAFNADSKAWMPRDEPDTRWYRYLFNQLLTSRVGRCSLAHNTLTIITFNFDRSFERALYRFVRANCADDDRDAQDQCRQIPVLHLHGQLGAPSWLAEVDLSPTIGFPPAIRTRSGGTFAPRGYSFDQLGPDVLKLCASQIRIVDDEVIHSAIHEHALTALDDAEIVCFLGFSYNPLNLQKLQLPRFAHKDVRGTAYLLPDGRRASIHKTFTEADRSGRSSAIDLMTPSAHILTFLEKADFLYE